MCVNVLETGRRNRCPPPLIWFLRIYCSLFLIPISEISASCARCRRRRDGDGRRCLLDLISPLNVAFSLPLTHYISYFLSLYILSRIYTLSCMSFNGLEYHHYARLCSLHECGWTMDDRKDKGSKQRAMHQLAYEWTCQRHFGADNEQPSTRHDAKTNPTRHWWRATHLV